MVGNLLVGFLANCSFFMSTRALAGEKERIAPEVTVALL